MTDTKIIYFRESWWQSLISDAGSFGILLLAMWINHHYFADSAVWGVILFVSILVGIASKGKAGRTDFTSIEELQKFLQDEQNKI